MSSLVSELRRRNVLRVAATYALIAWIIIEAGSVLMPTFGAPEWAFQIYVIAVFAGFVVSVIFAWIFEITPEGIKRDSELDRQPHSSRETRQKMNGIIIGLLIVALAVSITLNVTGLRGSDADSPLDTDRRSVAVLPFESLSSNPDNRLFANGIHDDLLTKLATIGTFKVISRSSVMEYEEATVPLQDIADELDVNTVLAGTVQRVGDEVRINMQLIDIPTGEHLWAQSFDRRLTMQDIFDIQSEISRSIASAMQSALSTEADTRLAAMPTDDLRAYSLYTEGKANLYQRRLETLLAARTQFEDAVRIDPEYADAWTGLAQSILLLMINHQEYTRADATRMAQNALDMALQLDPQQADAYATLGLMKQNAWSQERIGNEDLEAEQAFEKALSLNPNHASAYMWYASLRESQQRFEDAVVLYRRSLELDPLGRIPWSNLPSIYARRGQYQEAIDSWTEAIEIHPEWPTPYGYLAAHLAGMGRLDEALAWYVKAQSLSSDPFVGSNIAAGIFYEFGDIERAKESMLRLPPGHPFEPVGIAFATMMDGDFESAMQQLDKLIESGVELPQFVYRVASDVALYLKEYDKSRRYALLEEPILDSDAPLIIDRFTVDSIVKLAFIAKQTGDDTRSKNLLEDSLPVIQQMARLGMHGHGILDVEAYVILGRTEDALSAFEEAVDDGLRTVFMNSTFPADMNPYFESIREHPRFVAVLEEMRAHIAIMRDTVLRAEAENKLDELRRRTKSPEDVSI